MPSVEQATQKRSEVREKLLALRARASPAIVSGKRARSSRLGENGHVVLLVGFD